MSTFRSYLVVFWGPSPMSSLEPCIRYISLFFQRYGDIQCLDCGDHRDARTRRLLRQADLVVFTLPQDCREFGRLFCQNRVRFPNCVWLIMDYVPGIAPDLKQITFEFRIPSSRLAGISYSPRLREAKKVPGTGPLSSDIRRELNHAGQIMLRALGF